MCLLLVLDCLHILGLMMWLVCSWVPGCDDWLPVSVQAAGASIVVSLHRQWMFGSSLAGDQWWIVSALQAGSAFADS